MRCGHHNITLWHCLQSIGDDCAKGNFFPPDRCVFDMNIRGPACDSEVQKLMRRVVFMFDKSVLDWFQE